MPIVVPIDADVSGLTRKISSATSSLGGFGRMATFVAGAAALGGLVATVKVGVDEFMQAEKVTAQTNAVLKSTSGIANVTAKQVDSLASSIMRKSGMDDEAVKSAENLLLTFTKVRNEAGKGNDVFNQATKVTADLSVALGKDLNSSAMMVGKALNDPIKGVSALGRAGVQFTAAQKDQIKAMVESGNVMGAQKMILKELETQVGGSAEAFGKTLPGQLSILRETFNNLAGDLVASFMPSVARAAQSIVDFVTDLQARPTFVARVEFTIGKLRDLAGGVYNSLMHWWTTSQTQELPARVVLTPAGKDQVLAWAEDLRKKLNDNIDDVGYAVGRTLTASLFTGAKQGARDGGKDAGSSIVRSLFVNTEALRLGGRLAMGIYNGIKDELGKHSVMDLIEEWMKVQGTILPGKFHLGIGEALVEGIVSEVQQKLGKRGVLNRPQMAKIITDDMRSAIQSARNGLQGAASGIAGMMSQIIGARGTNPAADLAAARDLEDRRLSIQENALKAARDATEENTAERTQAQLDLDQFYYDKAATLRQRQVDDDQKKNQTQIEDLATRFNRGLIDAQSFATQLDAIIGGETGASLGESFSFGFTNALQSIKNAAADIFNIAGMTNPLGPDVGASGGPVAAAALQAYNDALAKWQDRQNALADKVKKLRDKANDDNSPGGKTITAAERAAINRAIDARDAHRDSKPDKKDYGLAAGGLLTGPRYFAGERGNEAVIPLGSPTAAEMMRKAFNDAVNGNNGGTTYQISINAGMGADGTDIGRQIVEAIKVFERRNGPVFAGA